MKGTKYNLSIKVNGKEVKNQFNAIRKEMLKLQGQVNNTTRGTKKYVEKSKELRKVKARLADMRKEMRYQEKWYKKMGKSFGVMTLGMIGGITAVFSIFRNAGRSIIELQDETARLASVMGKSRSEIKELTDDAKRLGATTLYTAKQITGLQVELAKLGFTQQEIINTTEAVQRFAFATGAELAEAAKVTGVALRAFNLDTTESERVTSVLAVATTKSALSFEDFETSISTVAPVARAFGFSIEGTTALLGKLKDAGFDASKSSTALRNILLNLADRNGDLAKKLGRTVSSVDELVPALIELRKKGVSLNEALQLTDKRSVAAFLQFLQTAEGVKTLKDEITDANDKLRDMEQERLDTVAAKTKLLSSAWDGLVQSFSESTGVMSNVIVHLTEMLKILDKGVAAAEAINAKDFTKKNKELVKDINKLNVDKLKQNLSEYKKELWEVNKELKENKGAHDTFLGKAGSALSLGLSNKYKKLETQAKKGSMRGILEGKIEITEEAIEKKETEAFNNEVERKQKLLNKTQKTEKELLEIRKVAIRMEDKTATKAVDNELDNIRTVQKAQEDADKEREKNREKKYNEEQKSRIEAAKKFKDDILLKNKTEIEQEAAAYEERLKKAGIFGKDKAKLTEKEKQVLEILELQHQRKLTTIETKAIEDKLKQKEQDYRRQQLLLKTNQNNELATIESIEEAKKLLKDKYSYSEEELSQLKTFEQTKTAIKKQHQKQDLESQTKHFDEIKNLLQNTLDSGNFEGIDLNNIILTEEQKETLIKKLDEVGLKLSKIGLQKKNIETGEIEGGELSQEIDKSNIDILGFSAEQWETTFENLDTTSDKIIAAGMALKAMSKLWGMYNEFVTASENRKLQMLEKSNERRKQQFKEQLEAGILTQEQYNQETEKLDKDLARTRAEMEYKQAKRRKISSIMESISNTALAITQALPNIPLSIIIGALGAIQTGIIAAQPLPPKTGFARGGFTAGLGYKDQSGEEVAGVVHADEYVIPKFILKQPEVPAIVEYLEAKRTQQIHGYAQGGGATTTEIDTDPEDTDNSETNRINYLLLEALTKFNENVENLEARVHWGYNEALKNKELTDRLISVRNNAKIQ